MARPGRLSLSILKNNNEFQSSIIRLFIWCLACIHLIVSFSMGHLSGNVEYYFWSIIIFLLIFVGILISILIRPKWPARLIAAMIIDIIAITVCFYPEREAINIFSLVYLLGVVSYGARYGKKHLIYFAVGSAIAYSCVAISQGLVFTAPTEVVIFLILLFALPVYQYMIISGRIAAEQATELKNRFLSTMTHELRTPLSGVMGMSRLLNSTRLDNEQHEYVKSILSASEVLMSLIGDILDFSKIEAKRLSIEKQTFSIRECVGAVCQILSNRAEDKKLELICRFDKEVPSSICSDEIRVKQVLYNLIGNAIKFTEHGEVEVRVSFLTKQPNKTFNLNVSVRDTGPGISNDKLNKIFEGFWQENISVTRKHGGTGLGTTISLELARMLGGEVNVSSTQGVGSMFQFILPLEADTTSYTPSTTEKIFSGKSFLVLEHNKTSFDTISEILSSAGATEIFKQKPEYGEVSAIILADDKDSLDLEAIAQSLFDAIGKYVPILVLGYASRKYDLKLPQWKFLPKPFIPEQLETTISNLLGKDSIVTAGLTDSTVTWKNANKPVSKILVAEDEPINAKLISILLTKKGHMPTLVENGTQALELLTKQHFDLAILDVRMPEMGGIEVTKRIRSLESISGSYIPIVALTASAVNDIRDACLSAGMDEFLLKPINPDVLDNVIERFT